MQLSTCCNVYSWGSYYMDIWKSMIMNTFNTFSNHGADCDIELWNVTGVVLNSETPPHYGSITARSNYVPVSDTKWQWSRTISWSLIVQLSAVPRQTVAPPGPPMTVHSQSVAKTDHSTAMHWWTHTSSDKSKQSITVTFSQVIWHSIMFK